MTPPTNGVPKKVAAALPQRTPDMLAERPAAVPSRSPAAVALALSAPCAPAAALPNAMTKVTRTPIRLIRMRDGLRWSADPRTERTAEHHQDCGDGSARADDDACGSHDAQQRDRASIPRATLGELAVGDPPRAERRGA